MSSSTRNRSSSPENQQTSAPSPRLATGNGKSRESAFVELKGSSTGSSSGVRPRKSVDELAKLPEKSPSITPLSKPSLQTNDLGEKAPHGVEISPHSQRRQARLRSPWSCSLLTTLVTIFAAMLSVVIARSFCTRQQDPKGAAMSYMRPSFVKFSEFDTEHTRFASKYSLYMYREAGIDEDTRVRCVALGFAREGC